MILTIITPLLNEAENVNPFLSNLNTLEGDFELIMVDGGSSDGTLEEIERCKAGFNRRLKVLESYRGRALQMNCGAKEAQGEILLFLHVDCMLHKDSIRCIEKAVYEQNMIGGGFRQAFSEPDLFLKVISATGNLRVKRTKIFYGDYGIFIQRDVFEKIGGYDNVPFLEEVELCRKAKKYGKLVWIDRPILTSSRRYSSKGRIRLTAAFMLANMLNRMGLKPAFLTKYIVDK